MALALIQNQGRGFSLELGGKVRRGFLIRLDHPWLGGRLWVVMNLSASISGWSNPLQSAVKSNANDWSGRLQTLGQLRCNYAIKDWP
jgi:hypothetical protein